MPVPVHHYFPVRTIPINIPDRPALFDEVQRRFREDEGFALATINLNHLVQLRFSTLFRAACAAQDLVVADGNPIVWLSRLAGIPVSLVPGSDLLRPLLELAAAEGMPVGFYGSSVSVLNAAAARLKEEIPTLNIAWTDAPPMGFDPEGADATAALQEMQAAGVRLCILALSAPRQEAFAAFGREHASNIGFCSFGASLEFVVGRQHRAPVWVRKLALEWLWRALSMPRRLIPRYAACIRILPALTVKAFRQRTKVIADTQSARAFVRADDQSNRPKHPVFRQSDKAGSILPTATPAE